MPLVEVQSTVAEGDEEEQKRPRSRKRAVVKRRARPNTAGAAVGRGGRACSCLPKASTASPDPRDPWGGNMP